MPLPSNLNYPIGWPVIYTDSKGKTRKTIILGVHNEDGQPYYTIKMRSKKLPEKQTIGERLSSPVDELSVDEITKTFAEFVPKSPKPVKTSSSK